jgi:hypothetical protein
MADLPERDAAFLLDMLFAARDALGFIRGLNQTSSLESRLHQNAVIRSLEIIGEAAGKVSADVHRSPGNSLARNHRHAPPSYSWIRRCSPSISLDRGAGPAPIPDRNSREAGRKCCRRIIELA